MTHEWVELCVRCRTCGKFENFTLEIGAMKGATFRSGRYQETNATVKAKRVSMGFEEACEIFKQ